MDHVVTTIVNMATGATRWQLGLDRVRAASQPSDDGWWALSQPVLASAMEGLERPISARVASSGQVCDVVGYMAGLVGDFLAGSPFSAEPLLAGGIKTIIYSSR